MATAVQKITLSSSRDIPFNKLVLSQSNVRRVKAGVSIEEMAESIARRGLIQSLHVRPVLDADGAESGMFEVPAGGRRYRALELLAKQKRLAKTAPVPCVVGDANSDILVDGTRSPAPVGCFHADVYPLFPLGKAWRDLGASFDFGLSFPQTVDADDNVLIDGGMSSYLYAGAFWEGISAWQLKMGPSLGLHYIFSDSNRRTAMLAGFRVTVYSQP